MPNNRDRWILIVLSILGCICSSALACEPSVGHGQFGTSYGDEGVERYAESCHGPDGALFADPYFLPFLEKFEEKFLLDAGCGAAPWSIYAATHGATVFGFDIQPAMIARGKERAILEQVEGQVILEVGDVAALPVADSMFDGAISIFVGCNLPAENGVFQAHFSEMYRLLLPEGRAIVTLPANFDVVFTRDCPRNGIYVHLAEVLQKLSGHSSKVEISKSLGELDEVLRATFVERDGALLLVQDEADLVAGEQIWRRIPGLVVPNFYYHEEDYVVAALDAGFEIEAIHRPMFNSQLERKAFNRSVPEALRLGEAYSETYPFVILELVKR